MIGYISEIVSEEKMKSGKLSEAVLKRVVLNQIKLNRDGTELPGIGIDASCTLLAQNKLLTASSMRQGSDLGTGAAAVHAAVNNIYASFGCPIGITDVLTFPESWKEQEIREWVSVIAKTCYELEIPLQAGHTAVSSAVSAPIAAITAIGSSVHGKNNVKEDYVGNSYQNDCENRNGQSGDTILMTGSAGKEGTGKLVKAHLKELRKRFSERFLEEALRFSEELSVRKEAEVLFRLYEEGKVERIVCHDCSEGGVFGALWEFGEALGCGMTLQLMQILLRQETIEICEYLNINPYQLLSGGSLLIVTEQPELVKMELELSGITVSVLGTLKESKDRILLRGEEVRYLEPYRRDELYQAYEVQ